MRIGYYSLVIHPLSATGVKEGFKMVSKVRIELNDGDEITYEGVTRVDDTDKYKITIYRDEDILAIINKFDIKNLISSEEV